MSKSCVWVDGKRAKPTHTTETTPAPTHTAYRQRAYSGLPSNAHIPATRRAQQARMLVNGARLCGLLSKRGRCRLGVLHSRPPAPKSTILRFKAHLIPKCRRNLVSRRQICHRWRGRGRNLALTRRKSSYPRRNCLIGLGPGLSQKSLFNEPKCTEIEIENSYLC